MHRNRGDATLARDDCYFKRQPDRRESSDLPADVCGRRAGVLVEHNQVEVELA